VEDVHEVSRPGKCGSGVVAEGRADGKAHRAESARNPKNFTVREEQTGSRGGSQIL
jgi:hypothetical protein